MCYIVAHSNYFKRSWPLKNHVGPVIKEAFLASVSSNTFISRSEAMSIKSFKSKDCGMNGCLFVTGTSPVLKEHDAEKTSFPDDYI